MNDRTPPPSWFLCLPLVAIALWWPLSPYWQSDDYLALHHAQDFGRVLHDFAGPQYGATDVWLFYRPLITLSFWVDHLLGGADPFVAHLSNVVAHGASTLLVALLWRRFLTDGQAFVAALSWAMLPSHAGSLSWAVGRVDSHTTVWCLLALVLFVRHVERGTAGERSAVWGALLATAAALLSKELAFVVPPLATVLGAVLAGGTPGQRLAFALRTAAPLWGLFVVYFAVRFWALGRFGGYLGAAYEPWPMLQGLGTIVADLAVPLRWIGGEVAAKELGGERALWVWLAAVPPLLAALASLRRPGRLLGALLLFLLASVPMAGFFAGADNVHNLRYFYLPSVVLAGAVAGGGHILGWLWLATLVLPFVEMRSAQLAADRGSAAMHRSLLREAKDGAPSPMFVAGLPHANPTGTVVQLHFGVDRMLLPPFGSGAVDLLALRPLAEVAGAVRLDTHEGMPFALPRGSTWFFVDATALGRAPEAPVQLPDLRIEGDTGGVLDVSTARLFAVTARAPELFARREPSFGLRTPGVKPMGYRVTIFTANGYLGCLCFDYGYGGAGAGSIDMLRFLASDKDGVAPAITATAGPAWAGEMLCVPTTIDRTTEFPVLIEAGSLRAGDRAFVPSHRARKLLTFRFDRDYPSWVRAVQGTGR